MKHTYKGNPTHGFLEFGSLNITKEAMDYLKPQFTALRDRAEAAEKALAEVQDVLTAADEDYPGEASESMMVARLLAERDAALAKLAAAEDKNMLEAPSHVELLKVEQQRDAALARVRELETYRCKHGGAGECRECAGEHNSRVVRVAELEGALREVLETACSCHCEAAYTDRGLHAPECHYDEVTSARRVLEGEK